MSFVQDGVIRAARLLVWPASIRVGGARNLDRGALVLEAAQEFELIIAETAFRRGVETARGEREFEFPHDEGRERAQLPLAPVVRLAWPTARSQERRRLT